MAAPLWRLGAQSASRRPLYRGADRKGDFEPFMSIEMCNTIVEALNLIERLAVKPKVHDVARAAGIFDAVCEQAKQIRENMP